MQRRSPPSEHVVDMRTNPAAPKGSRVRRLLHHDMRWLREVGMGNIADDMTAEMNGYNPNAPVPARRYVPLTPDITQAAHDLFSQSDMQGSFITLPIERLYPSGR